jgi:hypothetical protein
MANGLNAGQKVMINGKEFTIQSVNDRVNGEVRSINLYLEGVEEPVRDNSADDGRMTREDYNRLKDELRPVWDNLVASFHEWKNENGIV